MKSIFQKTLGALPGRCYLRHFLFGLMFPVISYFSLRDNLNPPQLGLYLLIIGNSIFYPYARFIYEEVVDFILGENLFVVNAGMMLFTKFLTMLACWLFALYIAPVGLIYLYFRSSADSKG